jgi:hypothetical protein
VVVAIDAYLRRRTGARMSANLSTIGNLVVRYRLL